jgi:C-terminal processing protease CtpA/Prc
MPLLEADHKILECFEQARRSVYGPGGDIQSASSETSGESSSIGLVVDAATRTVTSIVLGSAAHMSNQIAVGDVVVGVNGTPFTSDRYAELGQGQCGQFVDLTFSRAGTSEHTTVRLVREHRCPHPEKSLNPKP